MEFMVKLPVLLLLTSLFGRGADLGEVRTVYLLPMASGLDQFLAIRLTTGAILQVVTDPQKADAIFTDRIGAGFEQKLDELYGERPKAQDKDKDKDTLNSFSKPTMQPLTRGRGAIFLVDRKTRNVLWSMYEHPKNSTSAEMNHIADKIASKLNRNLKGK